MRAGSNKRGRVGDARSGFRARESRVECSEFASLEALEGRALLSSSLAANAERLWDVPGGVAIDAVVAGDFDGDGDLDLAASSGRRLAFFENTSGFGAFAPARVQQLSLKANLLATGTFDGSGRTGLLAVASGVGGSDTSSMRTLAFNTLTRRFEVRASRTVNGVVRQVAVGYSFHSPRDMVFFNTGADVFALYMPSATRLVRFPESAFSAPEGEEIAGIALRTDGAISRFDTRTLAVVTNTQAVLGSPQAAVGRVYNVGALEARLNPASSPIDLSPPTALHVYSGPSRLDSVLAGDLTGDGLSEIVVSGLLPSGGKPSQQLQVEYFDLQQTTMMMGPPPVSVYSAGLLNTPTGTPTLFVRAIGELNADGKADILAELRVPGAEGEGSVRALGLYQRSAGVFDAVTESSELTIPARFPPGAGVFAAKVSRAAVGMSVITLRAPGVTGPDAWSHLSIRRNTMANKTPVITSASSLGPTMDNPRQYLIAFVNDADGVRMQGMSGVEAYLDLNMNGVIDDADTLLGGFTMQTPASYPELTREIVTTVWYFRLPSSLVRGVTYPYLVRATDLAGATSGAVGGNVMIV